MSDASLLNSSTRKSTHWRLIVILLVLVISVQGIIYLFILGPKPLFSNETSVITEVDTIPVGIRKLLKAYPDHFIGATSNSLTWKDSTVMPYDDGVQNKNYDALLLNPDLEDQMSKKYVKGRNFPDPTENVTDTTKIRYTPFFEKMYGSTHGEVHGKLAMVRWLPKTQKLKMYVTTVNDINKKIQAISDELDSHPEWLKYVRNPGGAFNWRSIRGTDRKSSHSFGIAVDINIRYADYWLWDKQMGRPHKYKNRYPIEIIELFEKHGFIWGGKWYYYDTMHFEYRPEMLIDEDNL